jgi:hypothetical protein
MKFTPVPVREYAIVWEMRPDEARGALLEFGAEQRVVLKRSWRALRGAPLPSFLSMKQFRKVPVVVSLHPELAHTFILPFRLSRKKSEAPIQPERLQAMLRDFLAKTTFEMRRLAADSLGVDELDAILLDARLTRLLVDGEEARENRPVDGRRVEGYLQVTMTTRAVFHDLHDLLHSEREIFFTERGPAALTFFSRHFKGPATFLDLEPKGGWLFQLDHDAEEVIKKTRFQWDADDLPGALAEAWGVSKKTADELYPIFLRGEFSAEAGRFARKLFEPNAALLERAIAKAKISGKVHIRSVIPPPLKLPAVHGGVELEEFPLEDLLAAAGLTFKSSAKDAENAKNAAEESFFLLPLLEYYYHRGDPRAHKDLTRHIHWISA